LVPEVVPVAGQYPLIVFIDAHTGTIPEDVRLVRVGEDRRFHSVTHHMSPGRVLSMIHEITGNTTEAFLVSVRGENFDFGFGISSQCRQSADLAIRKILDLESQWRT
jgi:Ni,Fe-hydrogenase maturation factor